MSDNPPSPTIRRVESGDLPLLAQWWEAHDSMGPFPAGLLPPLGVVIEDEKGPACALWCYESYGVGVAFLEWPVSRPGLGMAAASALFNVAVDACILLAGKMVEPPGEYRAFRCFTLRPIAKVLKGLGFTIEPTARVAATLIIPQ